MKKHLLFTLLASFFYLAGHAQSCFPQGIVFRSQADVDTFPSVYPGCSTIEGFVVINGQDIDNLDSLRVLTNIQGDLQVYENTQLTNLEGLNKLKAIGGHFGVEGNPKLMNFMGLNALKTVGGNFTCYLNPKLGALDGLDSLQSIGGAFTCRHNDSLVQLNGLNKLTYVGDSMLILENSLLTQISGLNGVSSAKGIFINANKQLKSIGGFQQLREIALDLEFKSNDSLSNLDGFKNLKTVGKQLALRGNNLENMGGFEKLETVGGNMLVNGHLAMSTLSGLENLRTIGGSLEIDRGLALKKLSGLDSLESIGNNLYIVVNSVMENLTGLGNLQFVGGDVILAGNPLLNNLTGLGNLQFVRGDVRMEDNLVLNNLTGLEKLDSVGGKFIVKGNSKLSDCATQIICQKLGMDPDKFSFYSNAPGCNTTASVIANCHLQPGQCGAGGHTFSSQAEIDDFQITYPGCTDILGDVMITGWDIQNLNGLSHITKIRGTLSVQQNHELIQLNGLTQLDSIGGSLIISQNGPLASLAALSNLRSIGQSLDVEYNDALSDLSGLKNIATLSGHLSIYRNASLSSLNGLENLHAVGGYLNLQNLPALTDVDSLENLKTVGGYFTIRQMPALTNLDGMHKLSAIGGELDILYNSKLTSISGFANLDSIGGRIEIGANDVLTSVKGFGKIDTVLEIEMDNNGSLKTLEGFQNLVAVKNFLSLRNSSALSSISGFGHLVSIGAALTLYHLDSLASLNGLENLQAVVDVLALIGLPKLQSLSALSNLSRMGSIGIEECSKLSNLQGLEKITSTGAVSIHNNQILKDLSGLGGLKSVGWPLWPINNAGIQIYENPALTNLHGLENIEAVGGFVRILQNPLLADLGGLDGLASAEWFGVAGSPLLHNLHGLENLRESDYLYIVDNDSLTDLTVLANLNVTRMITIFGNAALAACAVLPVCERIFDEPAMVNIHDNAPGCNTVAEVGSKCASSIIHVEVSLLHNTVLERVPNLQVNLSGAIQTTIKPTNTNGVVEFAFLETGNFTLHIPAASDGKWQISEPRTVLQSSTGTDSTAVQILLTPLNQCPELTTTLSLPSVFRGCLVHSDLQMAAQNTGNFLAEGVATAVVLPPVFELVSTLPLYSGKSGDTLFFELGDLKPFETATVKLRVKTRCDTFLLGQTLCWEAFSTLDNACPTTLPAFSEIKILASCIGDSLVRFTLKNIGDAPTHAPHAYRILRNEVAGSPVGFNLAAQQSLVVDVPADAATYRMEATKLDDGTRTAAALENCAGLTPGQITAFWLEKGGPAYDFDCRQVVGSFDPNQKSAMPTGAGTAHVMEANRSLQYTIDFQNTGTDTAYRVLLRDLLPQTLDIASFRPIASSDSCTWQIHGNTLNVLFYPIALPDSNANEAASHGFFSFEIKQKPDLRDGTYFQNTASIIFDFNPAILTNQVFHTIGELPVSVFESFAPASVHLFPNPNLGTFTLEWPLPAPDGMRLRVLDLLGRQLIDIQADAGLSRQTLHAEMLPAGLYFVQVLNDAGKVMGVARFVRR